MPFSNAIINTIDNEPLRSFVKTLLDTIDRQSAQIERQSVQIEKLTKENEQLHAEIRHLKKQKGKPKIRPNTPDQNGHDDTNSDADDSDPNNQNRTNNNTPPKNKRPNSQQPGETAAPSLTVHRDEVCSLYQWPFLTTVISMAS